MLRIAAQISIGKQPSPTRKRGEWGEPEGTWMGVSDYLYGQPWENPVDLQGNRPESLRLDDQLAGIEGKQTMARGGVSIIFSSNSFLRRVWIPRGDTLQKEIKKIHFEKMREKKTKKEGTL